MADDPKVRRYEDHCLTEEGVIIHANLIPRKHFQLNIEGSRQGGWLDFTFAHSTLLFSKDESIAAWYKDAERIGARDRDYQLLRRAPAAVGHLSQSPEVVPGEEGLQLQLPVAAQRGRPTRQRRVHPQRPSSRP